MNRDGVRSVADIAVRAALEGVAEERKRNSQRGLVFRVDELLVAETARKGVVEALSPEDTEYMKVIDLRIALLQCRSVIRDVDELTDAHRRSIAETLRPHLMVKKQGQKTDG